MDTCEGFSLFEYIDVPNIYFVTSSVKDQKASSYSYDYNIMAPTADRMHFKIYENIQKIYTNKSFNMKIHDLFLSIQKEREWMMSDVTIRNEIKREIIFEEFFGNYLKRNNKLEFKNDLQNLKNSNKIENENSYLGINDSNIKIRTSLDKEVSEINGYVTKQYKMETNTRNKNVYVHIATNLFVFLLFASIFYLYLIKK